MQTRHKVMLNTDWTNLIFISVVRNKTNKTTSRKEKKIKVKKQETVFSDKSIAISTKQEK